MRNVIGILDKRRVIVEISFEMMLETRFWVQPEVRRED
jgi:hypothetical protein